MLDDFLSRAIVAGVGLAVLAGPLGCFIVWRRLAYFGVTLAHAALLGVAFALLIEINVTLAVFMVLAIVSLVLFLLQRRSLLSSDALLGLLAHATLALGLVGLAFMTWVRVDLNGLLFGDILAVSKLDILTIWIGGAVGLAILAMIWKPLFAATVSEELAAAEGMKPELAKFVFMILMAAVIATAMKIIGILLITAMLIVPAATARRFSSGPEQMAIIAALLGVTAVIVGVFGSVEFDTPTGPSIVLSSLLLFAISLTSSYWLPKQAQSHTDSPSNLDISNHE